MKIINIKFKFKFLIIILISLLIILSIIFLTKLFNNTIIMNNENYVNILKDVHDNIENYVGTKITTNGYIFRASDFNEKQFVVARDMIISESDYRIVGFLCESDTIKDFENNSWVTITGVISLKDYHGPMPIIEVTSINKIPVPDEPLIFQVSHNALN